MASLGRTYFSVRGAVVFPRRRLHCVAAAQMERASQRKARKENVNGDFFVDHTCIDCDTCRWMSPSVFKRAGDQSAVLKQPSNPEERQASIQALLSCPTSSIHMGKAGKGELKDVQETFPLLIPGCENIYFCGFMDSKSFAASSYFIQRPEGNVLIDCPRFNPVLTRKFDAMGGVDYIFLTHIDDVGDHKKWAERYKAQRIIHEAEVNADTRDCEIQFEGDGPWTVGDSGDIHEMEIISVPGHTHGSLCLLHKPSLSMFTGDHFGYSERVSGISIFPRYNKLGVKMQLESVLKLTNYDFVRVLPGHGRRFEEKNVEQMRKRIQDFVAENT